MQKEVHNHLSRLHLGSDAADQISAVRIQAIETTALESSFYPVSTLSAGPENSCVATHIGPWAARYVQVDSRLCLRCQSRHRSAAVFRFTERCRDPRGSRLCTLSGSEGNPVETSSRLDTGSHRSYSSWIFQRCLEAKAERLLAGVADDELLVIR